MRMGAPLRIGIDFDNTIACYDGVFRRVALEHGLVPADIGSSKNAVRDYLNSSGRKDEFTELQGYVYGVRMELATLYPGVRDFIATARARGHALVVVSHKTRHPLLGPKHDLHAAARGFLEAQGLVGDAMIPASAVHFELTKEEKVARAARLGMDVFIDDLPEILAMAGFPAGMRAILFDPERQHHEPSAAFEHCTDWASINRLLNGTTP